LDAAFGPIMLLGAEVSQTNANAGETVGVSLSWRSNQLTETDLSVRVSLLAAEANEASAVFEWQPVANYGTRQWRMGEAWLGQHQLRLPASLPTGSYELRLSVPGQAGSASLGWVAVTAPERLLVAPAMEGQSGARWEGVGGLAGFTLTQTGEALTLELVWQPSTTPEESYSVFVHLQAADGRVVRQSDGVPAGWTRPTTGWLAGEFIIDPHQLALDEAVPAGEYELLVGLYAPRTEQRVPVSGPGAQVDGRVLIARVMVP
jgi:hypothetical protein